MSRLLPSSPTAPQDRNKGSPYRHLVGLCKSWWENQEPNGAIRDTAEQTRLPLHRQKSESDPDSAEDFVKGFIHLQHKGANTQYIYTGAICLDTGECLQWAYTSAGSGTSTAFLG